LLQTDTWGEIAASPETVQAPNFPALQLSRRKTHFFATKKKTVLVAQMLHYRLESHGGSKCGS